MYIFQMIWYPERDITRSVLMMSNVEVSGPNNAVWIVETVMMVGTGYVLAYLVPQVCCAVQNGTLSTLFALQFWV